MSIKRELNTLNEEKAARERDQAAKNLARETSIDEDVKRLEALQPKIIETAQAVFSEFADLIDTSFKIVSKIVRSGDIGKSYIATYCLFDYRLEADWGNDAQYPSDMGEGLSWGSYGEAKNYFPRITLYYRAVALLTDVEGKTTLVMDGPERTEYFNRGVAHKDHLHYTLGDILSGEVSTNLANLLACFIMIIKDKQGLHSYLTSRYLRQRGNDIPTYRYPSESALPDATLFFKEPESLLLGDFVPYLGHLRPNDHFVKNTWSANRSDFF